MIFANVFGKIFCYFNIATNTSTIYVNIIIVVGKIFFIKMLKRYKILQPIIKVVKLLNSLLN